MTETLMENENSAAVVLGGYVNGYSIIRELYGCGVKKIALVDYGQSLGSFSNKIVCHRVMDKSGHSLLSILNELHGRYGRLIVFPTDDLQLELLLEIYREIEGFCFIPFNPGNLIQCLDKSHQYACCERLGIPYPRTRLLASEADWAGLEYLQAPFLVKPAKRDDLSTSVFRNLYVASVDELHKAREDLLAHVREGVRLIVSECVPGDDTHIYAYTAYRSREGSILNEWIGKKLTQYPDEFGVFSSASNQAPGIVREQGRKLLEGLNLWGIAEPEFKFDARDGQYKLMEINLRSMMWHRTGHLSGVYLQYAQWLDALGLPVTTQQQNMDERIHFIYLKHELLNLLGRRGYWRHFKHNVFGGGRRHFAVFDSSDIKPFLYDFLNLFRAMVRAWLRHSGSR